MITFPTFDTVDLFAGPGGWSVAARRLGLREMGVEFDKAAHLTRRAAGFHTIRADVRALGPAMFPHARGLIASPPCQTFSSAGKGAGRKALDVVLAAVRAMGSGLTPDTSGWTDERTSLVLEPLRWVIDAMRLGQPYQWLAFEQVPTVLPVWEAMAHELRGMGYQVQTAVLNAEQYGVPQTRRRAILVARLERNVSLPMPTHSRYYSRDKARLDPGVLPWVSMGQALGWSGVVGFPRLADSADTITLDGIDYRARDMRATDQPAQVVTEKARSWQLRANAQTNAAVRDVAEPAPTITGGNDTADRRWFAGAGATAVDTSGQQPRPDTDPAHTVTGVGSAAWVQPAVRFGNQDHSAVRAADEPAATVRYGERMNACDWVHERPATTVVGSFSPETIAAPGYRVSTADGSRQNAPGSVRVTVEEAAALQSFPVGFPWQGSKTKRYQQVGNAIPPVLAEAVLRAVIW